MQRGIRAGVARSKPGLAQPPREDEVGVRCRVLTPPESGLCFVDGNVSLGGVRGSLAVCSGPNLLLSSKLIVSSKSIELKDNSCISHEGVF